MSFSNEFTKKLNDAKCCKALILIDFTNTVVAQEIIDGEEGDNILNIYVNSLPVSSYTVELYTRSNTFIGKQSFSMN